MLRKRRKWGRGRRRRRGRGRRRFEMFRERRGFQRADAATPSASSASRSLRRRTYPRVPSNRHRCSPSHLRAEFSRVFVAEFRAEVRGEPPRNRRFDGEGVVGVDGPIVPRQLGAAAEHGEVVARELVRDDSVRHPIQSQHRGGGGAVGSAVGRGRRRVRRGGGGDGDALLAEDGVEGSCPERPGPPAARRVSS